MFPRTVRRPPAAGEQAGHSSAPQRPPRLARGLGAARCARGCGLVRMRWREVEVMALTCESVEELFADIAYWEVPEISDRYDYKKDPGSSDTRHQQDEIRT